MSNKIWPITFFFLWLELSLSCICDPSFFVLFYEKKIYDEEWTNWEMDKKNYLNAKELRKKTNYRLDISRTYIHTHTHKHEMIFWILGETVFQLLLASQFCNNNNNHHHQRIVMESICFYILCHHHYHQH